MQELRYSYIDFIAMENLNISLHQYIVCAIIQGLQIKTGTSYASLEYIAKLLNLSKAGVQKIIKNNVEDGLIEKVRAEKGKTLRMKVTDKWLQEVVYRKTGVVPNTTEPVYQVQHSDIQSTTNSNNNINIESNKDITANAEESLPLFEEKKVSGADINAVVSYFYNAMAPGALGNSIKNKTIRGAAEGLLLNYSIKEIRENIDRNKAQKEGFGKCYSLGQFTERFEAIRNTQGVSRPVFRNLDEE